MLTDDAMVDDHEVLVGLTEPQREAVLRTEGPLLVLAGPGSGKTRVITRRIAHLIHEGIPPWQILAVTFTNKAAGEMRQRVMDLLGDQMPARGLTITTFHALCARLLRRYADIAQPDGRTATFTIYDSSDQSSLVKRALNSLNLPSGNWPPRAVLSEISGAKNRLIDAKAYGANASDFYSRTVAKAYEAYEAGLRKANAVDFDDLLLLTGKMLREHEEVRVACNDRWQYLMVDEYQDTNHAQLVLATLLAGDDAAPNICVVGDPDQSIYGWRGADIANILEFEEQYPSAHTINLGENFRSSEEIIASADALIRNNKRRKHKPLIAVKGPSGTKVETVLTRDERHDAEVVADWLAGVRESTDGGITWKDQAIFYRMNALSRVMEEVLRSRAIPYVIARGTAFYEREEIRHALGYLRVVANPNDDVSLARVVNVPTRGIGAASLAKVEAAANRTGSSMMAALYQADRIEGVSSRALNAINAFVEMLDAWSGAGTFMGQEVSTSLADLVERVIRESGLEKHYKAGRTEKDEERLENLAELVSSASDFEKAFRPEDDPAADAPAEGVEFAVPPMLALLRAYLEHVTLVSDADKVDPSQGAVTLMTLHAAKGLEFKAVAMIGLEEGSLPHGRARESEDDLEEERRLCFVGVTRAMERLVMTSARFRTIRGVSERTIPSRFLEELPGEHVSRSDQSESFDPAWDDPMDVEPSGEDGMAVGVRVVHPRFGQGRIVGITRGRNARARVEFVDVGTKTLLLQYARLERI